MAMSEVAPLTVWSPLAWIASLLRLNSWLVILNVVYSSRCEGVVVDEVVVEEQNKKCEVGRCLYWQSGASGKNETHFCYPVCNDIALFKLHHFPALRSSGGRFRDTAKRLVNLSSFR